MLDRVVRDDFSAQVIFEQSPEWYLEKRIPGRRTTCTKVKHVWRV